MKKYIGILETNPACDYSIGCGIKVIKFESKDSVEAGLTLKSYVKENHHSNEDTLKVLTFFEYSDAYSVDLERWYREFKNERAIIDAENKAKEELAEYHRLKAKLNL